MSSFFPCISKQSYFWVTLIFSGHGFGTSRLLFSFFYLKFLCLCYYYYYHYYHQIIFFFKFSHLIYVCWVSYSYYGNSSVTGGNLENNRLQRVLLFPLELSKPAKVVQAATKKIRRKKRRRSTKHGPNLESCLSRDLGDFDQGRFRKPALFRRSLRLLRLKADTSRIKTC